MPSERCCPVCSNLERTTIYTTPTKQTINCCVQCGMVYADGSPAMDYAKDSIYTCAETYQSQAAHYERIVENVTDAGVDFSASVLDVGCAVGGLMQALLSAGFKTVHGMSLSAGEVALCESRGLTAFQRDIANLGILSPYDLVTVSHVLEHVPDVPQFLYNLRRWVKPNGLVYIEVPDASKYAECFTSICQGFNSEHINHFSLEYLREALRKAGYYVHGWGAYTMPIERTDSTYPCIWAVATPREFGALRSAIENYRNKLVPQVERINENLRRSLSGPFVIWGMGETARMLLHGGAIDLGFVLLGCDTNPVYHDRVVHGVSVVSPEQFKPRSEIPILICSQTRKNEIAARIRELGLTNRIITLGE